VAFLPLAGLYDTEQWLISYLSDVESNFNLSCSEIFIQAASGKKAAARYRIEQSFFYIKAASGRKKSRCSPMLSSCSLTRRLY